MKTFWMILAGVGIVVAAFFLWRRDFDKAFISAALGMVAWLLNYRAQMKEIVRAADVGDEDVGDEDVGDENEENQGDEEEDVEDSDDK